MPDPAPAATPKKRGPRTPEGKARSAMNALKHGLRAQRFLLLPEEDASEFSSFAADIRFAYRPADAVEAAQVEGIVVAMWREIRADRIEGEEMGRNQPAAAGLGHGTDLAHANDRASLATALRYRSQAQLELKRATDLFWSHRKARLAGLLEEAEEEEACANEFSADPRTNEFPAAPDSEPAEVCTNEFRASVPPPPERPANDTVTLLSTYRALKKRSAGDAWAWLNDLPPETMEKLKEAIANEIGPQHRRGGPGGSGAA